MCSGFSTSLKLLPSGKKVDNSLSGLSGAVQFIHGKERTKRARKEGQGERPLAGPLGAQQALDEGQHRERPLHGPNGKDGEGLQGDSNEVILLNKYGIKNYENDPSPHRRRLPHGAPRRRGLGLLSRI